MLSLSLLSIVVFKLIYRTCRFYYDYRLNFIDKYEKFTHFLFDYRYAMERFDKEKYTKHFTYFLYLVFGLPIFTLLTIINQYNFTHDTIISIVYLLYFCIVIVLFFYNVDKNKDIDVDTNDYTDYDFFLAYLDKKFFIYSTILVIIVCTVFYFTM